MRVFAVTLLAIVLVALLMWRPWESGTPGVNLPSLQIGTGAQPGIVDPAAILPSVAVPPPTPAIPETVTTLSPAEITQVRDAIDNLEFVFRDYATGLGGNPVGTNAEITAALLGNNEKQLRLDLPRDSTVNAAGELCDPWGSPWFFHQLSRLKMEIRSAGRDRQLYTDDDFVR